MDEWDRWYARMEIAKSENRNAFLNGGQERRVKAKRVYDDLIEEFHYMFEIHREKVEHGTRPSQAESQKGSTQA